MFDAASGVKRQMMMNKIVANQRRSEEQKAKISKENQDMLKRLVMISAGKGNSFSGDLWKKRIIRANKSGEEISIYSGENVAKNLAKEVYLKELERSKDETLSS